MLHEDEHQVNQVCADKQQNCHGREVANRGDLDNSFDAHLHPGCNNYHPNRKCDYDIYNHR
jgi:hypothetical protein